MPKINYIYCDANVFLAYFSKEQGRIHIIDQLFDEVAKNPRTKLITSALTITEVSHIADERRKNRTNSQIYQAFEDFWDSSNLIEFIELDATLARQARDFIRQTIDAGLKLRTNDAIHLVSAKNANVDDFFTYDAKLPQFSRLAGYSISEPYLKTPLLPLDFDDE